MNAEAGIVRQNFVWVWFGSDLPDEPFDAVVATQISRADFGLHTVFFETFGGNALQCILISARQKYIESCGGKFGGERLSNTGRSACNDGPFHRPSRP
jgi:hypothetical protein